MESPPPVPERRPAVGIVFDERMCLHATPDGEIHPENPERLRVIWRTLESTGITQRCVIVEAKEADDKYLSRVHSNNHIMRIKSISSDGFDKRRSMIARNFSSIYFNKGSSESAYLAAGSTIEVARKVAVGELNSGIALVRPPGHHAEHDSPMGFCLFNNVAVTAQYLLDELPEAGIRKVLIVDWDVHHGNGTQDAFYSDDRVLFFSVHRFDFGNFYPSGGAGSLCMIGDEAGRGYNINVPWEHGQCGDADYIAVWDHILIPVAEVFSPDIILISAGFDAAMGDPLGGCCITPHGYACLLDKLMKFANGKIVMVLEGGYNLKSLSKSVLACAEVLLEDKTPYEFGDMTPFESTWRVVQQVRGELNTYWPVLAGELPQKLLENSKSFTSRFDSDSDLTDEEISVGVSSLEIEDKSVLSSWRADFSKVTIWYGCYGSNMWKPRFLCYINGGKVEGMGTACRGTCDKSPPQAVKWTSVPHRLFFGRSFSRCWGDGGVAFLHPEPNTNSKSHICLYKITLEQFNDLLCQEASIGDIELTGGPLVSLSEVGFITEHKYLTLEAIKNSWYSSILYLGKDDGIPMLTFTCSLSDAAQYKSGTLPVLRPSSEYARTIVRGLVEGNCLDETQAMDYIIDASIREL